MDLVQVDVVGPESPQAVLERIEDVDSGLADLIRPGAHAVVHLAGEHQIAASAPEHRAQQLLGLTVPVRVRRVDEVHAGLQGHVDQSTCDVEAQAAEDRELGRVSTTEIGSPQADAGDEGARTAQLRVLHRIALLGVLP